MRSSKFLIDIISSIPVYIVHLLSRTHSSFMLIKLLKLARILRFRKLISYMRINKGFKMTLRLFKLLLFLFIYLHFITCSWWWLINVDENWAPIPFNIKSNPTVFYDINPSRAYFYCFYTALYTLVGMEMLPNYI